MYDIFVSHASDDNQRVEPLVNALREEGFRVWWDGDLQGGDRYLEKIDRMILESRCIVVCWTKAALELNRDWIRAEAEKAHANKKVFISVLFERVDLPVPFNAIQAVELTQWSGQRSDPSFTRLCNAIRGKLQDSLAPSSIKAKKLALVVGVSSTNSASCRLPAAGLNAKALQEILARPGSGFDVTIKLDPDRIQLETAIDRLTKAADASSLIVLYYSGCILLTEDKTLLLSANNTDFESYTSSALDLRDIDSKYLAKAKSDRRIIIVDACYARVTDSGCQYDLTRMEIENAWQLNLDMNRAKAVIASAAGETANPANWNATQTPLTKRLIRGLVQDARKVDLNDDKVITLAELTQYLTDASVYAGAESQPLHWEMGLSSDNIQIAGTDPPPAPVEALSMDQKNFVAAVATDLKLGRIIPFFGDGVYGKGPLSFSSITKGLVRQYTAIENFDTGVGIATVAETLRLQSGGRQVFLQAFQEILSSQAKKCDTPAAYDLVLELKPPWLVVTVNYDDLLERRLADAKRPYVIVTHILRSGYDDYGDAEDQEPPQVDHGGKVLIVRSEDHTAVKRDPTKRIEICMSSELALENDDCVIYRLLGAPFINEIPAVNELQLDTVVVTETDHIDFLNRLRRPDTAAPKRFTSRYFRDKRVLFFEYNLDVWHYRLIGHLFRQRGRNGRADGSVVLGQTPYVVRTLSSVVEQLFWQRFSAQQTSIDGAPLLQALRAKRTP